MIVQHDAKRCPTCRYAAKKTMSRAAILKQIELLRAKNNRLWMGYVKLAIKHAPKQALKLHKQVMALDAKITEFGRKLHD